MAFPTGKNIGNRGKGRPKGSQNKISASVREMIEGALQAKGGQKWLEKFADDHPVAFSQLVGKILPVQEQGAGNRALPATNYTFRVYFPEAPARDEPRLIENRLIDVTPPEPAE